MADAVRSLQKEPYADTRPLVPCFTRHAEFFKEPRRPHLPIESATWQLKLRSQTPAFTGGAAAAPAPQPPREAPPAMSSRASSARPEKQWNRYFHHSDHSCITGREHSFDMLGELRRQEHQADAPVSARSTASSSLRTPRVRADAHRARLFLDEPYRGKVTPNMDNYRDHLQSGAHPDVCRWIMSIGVR